MDARRNQVYAAFYMWENDKLIRLTDHMAESIERVIEIAEMLEQEVIFLGDGVPVHRERTGTEPCVFIRSRALQYAKSICSGSTGRNHGRGRTGKAGQCI